MKIIEAINRLDALRPNTYTFQEKLAWLSALDGMVFENIIKTHEGAAIESFEGYADQNDTERELLIPSPYDEAYIHWLCAKVDYYNGESAKYANSSAQYNAVFGEYSRWYNRTHMPIGTKIKVF